jgi:hypothetical protein
VGDPQRIIVEGLAFLAFALFSFIVAVRALKSQG